MNIDSNFIQIIKTNIGYLYLQHYEKKVSYSLDISKTIATTSYINW